MPPRRAAKRQRAQSPAAESPDYSTFESGLAAFDEEQPSAFYFRGDDSLEQLADSFAVVAGVRLPLHSHVLATAAAVLRDLFLSRGGEGGAAAEGPTDLSAAFADPGASLKGVAAFLRLVYAPDEAADYDSLAIADEAGCLHEAALWAHKLDAPRLLRRIAAYMEEVCAQATEPQLMAHLRTAVHCELEALQAACFAELGRRLAEAGPRAAELLPQETAAALDSTTLARLMHAAPAHVQGGAYRPPPISSVRPSGLGRVGGFTWTLPDFSQKGAAVICSPWVRVAGLEWRLKFWPEGDANSSGHLSLYLELNPAAVQAGRTVSASFDLNVVDQQGGQDLTNGTTHTYAANAVKWGFGKFASLEALTSPNRAFLKDDRLVLRVDVCVASIARAAAA